MAIEIELSTSAADVSLTGVVVYSDLTSPNGSAVLPSARAFEARGFEGKAEQVAMFDVDGGSVLCVGLGAKEELTQEVLRRSAAVFVRSAAKSSDVTFDLTGLPVAGATQAVVEGLLLGAYRFGEFKTKEDDTKLQSVHLVGGDQQGLDRGRVIAKAVCEARDMINCPPSDMTPRDLVEKANRVATKHGFEIRVWDESEIETEGMGGLLGVSRGSSQPPRMVKMVYAPAGATETIAIVGKGITFDSGGLSLKTPDGMTTMKTDMSGAANVIATMDAIGELKPKARVIALFAATENLPGPSATKPGDVLKARNGKTMEVLNTDAEGRLVLADALSLAVEAEPDAIVDVATLTGACIVALGSDIAGLMGNNEAWQTQVQQASNRTGEEVWPLPLPKRYRKQIDSEVADIKNMGGKSGAGTLTAGLFLQEFVADVPWVHLDIAGPSRAEGTDGYITRGASGFGVRTLVDLIENFEKPSR